MFELIAGPEPINLRTVHRASGAHHVMFLEKSSETPQRGTDANVHDQMMARIPRAQHLH